MQARIFFLNCVSLLFIGLSSRVSALNYAMNYNLVETGDERSQPAIGLQLDGFKDGFGMRFHNWGRKSNIYRQSTSMFTGEYTLPVMSDSKKIFVAIGLSVIYFNSKIALSETQNTVDQSVNSGLHLGLLFRHTWSKFFFEAAWQSTICPAGLAGLFLATGRVHMLGVALGVGL